MFQKISRFMEQNVWSGPRYDHIADAISSYLESGSTILDLGCSSGGLAKKLHEKDNSLSFIGVDTHIQPNTQIPVAQYDGYHLPFKDNSFDISMLVDVLHHDTEPEKIIAEAKRVAKKVVIKDHYYDSKIGFEMLKVSDYLGNKAQGIALPYNFLTMNEWYGLFDQQGLRVCAEEKFRFNLFDICKHVVFELEPIR